MSISTSQIYVEKILELNKKPLNYGIPSDKDYVVSECKNPHCGDTVILYVSFELSEADRFLREIMFYGESCAVTRASASLMTKFLSNMDVNEAKKLENAFYSLILGESAIESYESAAMKELQIFQGIHQHPARRTCALLPWNALKKILHNL